LAYLSVEHLGAQTTSSASRHIVVKNIKHLMFLYETQTMDVAGVLDRAKAPLARCLRASIDCVLPKKQ
jgi:hypothetical protein